MTKRWRRVVESSYLRELREESDRKRQRQEERSENDNRLDGDAVPRETFLIPLGSVCEQVKKRQGELLQTHPRGGAFR